MKRLSIKNMVCNRCISAVKQQFEKAGITPIDVRLGEVDLESAPSHPVIKRIEAKLSEMGFDILDDKRTRQIHKIKTLLTSKVQSGEIEEHFVISSFLASSLNREYSQVSRLFSEVEGITIEQFFIFQKINKVKEWLVYDGLSLGEIAWKLGYNSIAHLSAQFKKVTGITPTEFKRLGHGSLKPLDKV